MPVTVCNLAPSKSCSVCPKALHVFAGSIPLRALSFLILHLGLCFLFLHFLLSHLQYLERGTIFGEICQDLNAIFSDQQRVLELGRPLPICCHGRPLVIPSEVFPHASIDHRLYGEDVARLHEAYRHIFAVVRHLRSLMEHVANAVTSVAPNDRVP